MGEKKDKEYQIPVNTKPPPPPKYNGANVVLEKKVEPGRWVMTLGAAFMAVAFGLGLTSAFMPWWVDESLKGGDQQVTEVTLWVIKTVTTLQAKEEEHIGCDSSCDQ